MKGNSWLCNINFTNKIIIKMKTSLF